MNIKHIVLPLEPGSQSENMIRSGIKLASITQARLSFLYVLNTANYAAYTGSNAAVSVMNINEQKESIEKDYIEMLEQYKSDIPAGVSLERSIAEGPWVSSIVDYVEKNRPGMLLLNHEEQGFLERILGDTNTEILHGIDIPALIIPDQGLTDLPGKLAYITDHQEGDIEAMKQFHGLCDLFKASLSLLHVNEGDEFDDRLKREGFKAILSKELKDCKMDYHEIRRKNMNKELKDLISDKKIDLISMKNESENFLTRFFNRSSLEKLIDSVDIPLLIYS